MKLMLDNENSSEIKPETAVKAYNILRDFCKNNSCNKDCPFYYPQKLKIANCYFSYVSVPNDWKEL